VPEVPEIHYARSADGTNIAYRVAGDGPVDLVFLSGQPFPVDLLWEDPGFARVAKRLRAFSRSVWYESLGWGASEGDFRDTFEVGTAVADLVAVLDAAGFERVALVGEAMAGARTVRFALAHPERLGALVLLNSCAHYLREEDYPWGVPAESLDDVVAFAKQRWGTGATMELLAPSRAADTRFREWWVRCERLGAGPDAAVAAFRFGLEQDVRPLLPAVSAPTLVLHRQGNRYIDIGAGQDLAERIPGAKFVALPGDDHVFFSGDTDGLVDEIEDYLTGRHHGAEGDVVTATVVFTDIVASTERQAGVGQGEWSRLTDRHDAMVRAALARHRGREVKTTGDGFLATFDAAGRALRCTGEVQFRRRPLLRLHRGGAAHPADGRHGSDARRCRLLAGGVRRRGLQLW
jgi:pimeloyl-ACP methyl ester carboxylesterase